MKEERKYHIRGQGPVCEITLFDSSLTSFTEALAEVGETLGFKEEKILFMQTITKADEPMKILIVFDFI